jgi:hypothetical protein
MPVRDPELVEWNAQAAAFLALSPWDQELYIAAVNAGADPELLLQALERDGVLEALAASGVDPFEVFLALPSDVAAELVAEAAIGVFGF